MDRLVELVPQSGLVRLGASLHPCAPGPGGRLTVYGEVLRPLTLAECELIAVYARSGGPDESAALARGMACDGDAPGDAEPDAHRAAVEAVALFLAGATGTGPLPGLGASVARRLGVPLPDALALTVLAADAAVAAGEAVPQPADDGWTTYAIVPGAPDATAPRTPDATPAPEDAEPTAAGDEARRVRDLLAARFVRRLAGYSVETHAAEASRRPDGPVTPEAGARGDGHVPAVDRWGAPVEEIREVAPVEGARPEPAALTTALPATEASVPPVLSCAPVHPHAAVRGAVTGSVEPASLPAPLPDRPAPHGTWPAPRGTWHAVASPPQRREPAGTATAVAPASVGARGGGSRGPAADPPARPALPTGGVAEGPSHGSPSHLPAIPAQPWAQTPDAFEPWQGSAVPPSHHPDERPAPVPGGAAPDVDAVALRLALDLEALADLRGVAR